MAKFNCDGVGFTTATVVVFVVVLSFACNALVNNKATAGKITQNLFVFFMMIDFLMIDMNRTKAKSNRYTIIKILT
jgi:hypothetical protein